MGNFLLLLFAVAFVAFVVGMWRPAMLWRGAERRRVFAWWVLFVVVWCFVSTEKKSPAEMRAAYPTAKPRTQWQIDSARLAEAQKMLRQIRGFDPGRYRSGELGHVVAGAGELESYQLFVREMEGVPHSETAEVVRDCRTELARLQTTAYPALRDQYGLAVFSLMRKEGIDALDSGKSSNVLTFTGAVFASKKFLYNTHNQLAPVLTRLRFRKVCYKWYSGDDGECYTLWEKGDAVLFDQ